MLRTCLPGAWGRSTSTGAGWERAICLCAHRYTATTMPFLARGSAQAHRLSLRADGRRTSCLPIAPIVATSARRIARSRRSTRRAALARAALARAALARAGARVASVDVDRADLVMLVSIV